jgi:hypothetical protein
VVEAQHQVSTMKLTDSLPEQAMLENLIEDTKPKVPADSARLHYLLMTPFRYSRSNPWGSRFRRPHAPDGVFYAAEYPATAVAEMSFHRLLFFADSPQTSWPKNAGEYTAFASEYRSERTLDMTAAPFRGDAKLFDLSNYDASQSFADEARTAAIDVLKYVSVRDPERRHNFALLKPDVFTNSEPVDRQSWRIHFDANGVRALCEMPQLSLAFGRDAFAADVRMTGMTWER